MYQDDPQPFASTSQMEEAKRLYKRWKVALERKEFVQSDQTDHEEQTAYDTLIDYIEANDLNYSEFDPR